MDTPTTVILLFLIGFGAGSIVSAALVSRNLLTGEYKQFATKRAQHLEQVRRIQDEFKKRGDDQ